MLSSFVFVYTEPRSANQNPRLGFSRPTLDAAPLFLCPPSSISPLFATHTSCPQIPENTITLSPFLATHTGFAPVSPVFATHTKTIGVCSNNSHSETPFRPSRFLRNLGISALNSIFSPSTFNPQLSTSFPSLDLSFHALTNCPPHNLFLFTSLQMPGGVGGSVQKFLKHYFNCGRISGRLNHLQGAGFTSHHEPPVTSALAVTNH
jgi:hypothetical protein